MTWRIHWPVHLKFRHRIVLFTLPILALVFALFAYFGARSIDKETDRLLQQRLVIAELIAQHVDNFARQGGQELESIADMLSQARMDPAKAREELAAVRAAGVSFTELVVLDGEGNLVAVSPPSATPPEVDMRDDTLLATVSDGNSGTAFEAPTVAEGGVIRAAAPVMGSDGVPEGYVMGLVDMEDSGLIESMPTAGMGERAYVQIVDKNGLILGSTRPGPFVESAEHALVFANLVATDRTAVSTCHSCHTEEGPREKDVLALAPTSLMPLGLVVREPEDDVLAPARSFRRQVIIAGSAGLVVVGLLVWGMASFVTRPLGGLITASERIAEGDLTTRVPSAGTDEIGTLAGRLDGMRERLSAWRSEMDRWNEELEDAVRQRTAELRTLLDISMALPATADLDDVLQAITDKTVKPFEAANAGVLFLYDPEEDRLVARASVGYEQESLARVRLRPGECIVGKVYESGESLLCATRDEVAQNMANISDGNRRHLEKAFAHVGRPQSAMCVALASKDSVLGALMLMNPGRERGFSDSDLRLLQGIANQIAIVVENARLWVDARQAEALVEADRLKDEFLSSISHELLTPITAMRAAADMLVTSPEDGEDTARTDLMKDVLRRNTERLQSQVQQLLELARLQKGALGLLRETWDMRAIMEEGALAVRPLTEEKGQTLTVTCPPAPCLVEVDRERMEQVVINLVSNASKFTPREGSIELELREEEGEFLVSVTDTGPGIPVREQERVFDRFYSRSRGRDGKGGSGLGLAIARALVELHGGRIWVSSATGRGSTFSFTVPKGNGDESADR